MKRHKKLGKHSSSTEDYYRRRLFNPRQLVSALLDLRSESPDLVRHVLQSIDRIPRARPYVFGNPFPDTYDGVGHTSSLLPPTTLEQDLWWEALILRRHSEAITRFLALRDRIDTAIFLEHLPEAQSILQETKSAVGHSIWALNIEILLAALGGGLQANKTVRRDLIARLRGVPQLLAHCFSMRAEETISAATYESGVRELVSGVEASFGTAFVLRSAPYAARDVSDAVASELLSDGPAYSIVDRYITFVRLITFLGARTGLPRPAELGSITRELSQTIPDPFLITSSWLLGAPVPLDGAVNADLMALLDLYTRGRYQDAMEAALAALSVNPSRFEYHEIYARAALHTEVAIPAPGDTTSDAGRLSHDVAGILRNDAGTPACAKSLWKFAYTYEGTRLAQQAAAFMLHNDGVTLSVEPMRFAVLSSAVLTPRSTDAIPDLIGADSLLAELARIAPGNESVALFMALHSRSQDKVVLEKLRIPRHRQLKYNALYSLRSGHLSDAAQSHAAIAAAQFPGVLSKIEAQIGLYGCYLKQDALDKCRELLVEAYVSRGGLLHGSDLAHLVKLHLEGDVEASPDDITIPLLYHIAYQEGVSCVEQRHVFESLEHFLDAHGVLRPSQLLAHESAFPRSYLICLLRHVCVQETLDHSIAYASTDELERERIEICHALRSLDPTNETTYVREISRLSTAASIRKTLETVGRSKVHADTDGIVQSLDATFQQQFARYAALQSLDPSLLAEVSASLGGNAIIVISKETTALFASLFNEIKGRFISSNAHGLDSYLSVRIRHGTLAGQVRSPFERQHLLTRRESSDGEYQPNDHWVQRLAAYGRVSGGLDAAFATFSRSIDSTIDEVRDQWIQIRGDSNRAGLFDFDYSATQLVLLQARVGIVATEGELIEGVLGELWARTEVNIARVRGEITGSLARRLTDSLDVLVKDLSDNAPSQALPEFRAAVATCRTELANTLAEVSQWFTRGGNVVPPDFTIQVAIDTSVAIMQRTFLTSVFAPHLAIADNLALQGRFLPHVLDVLYILFENVVRHGRANPMDITVRASVDETYFWLEVTNAVKDGVDLEELRKEAIELQRHASEGARRAVIRREGGSGYYKLGKILTHDFRCSNWRLNVAVTENRAFSAQIGVLLREVQA